MIGYLYINDKDAWTTWSVGLTGGSYANLLAAPSLKTYTCNDMASHDGTQVFVSDPKVAARDVILTFGIVCESTNDYLTKYANFINELQKGYIMFKVPKLKTVYKLLFSSSIELNAGSNLTSGTVSIRFNEPNPKDRILL